MFYSTALPYTPDASSYYRAIADLPWAVWLDSAGMGRYDIVCAQPVATLVTQGLHTEIINSAGTRISDDDPYDLLRQQLGQQIEAVPDIPFAGGAIGYWGYDLARRTMTLPDFAQADGQIADMAVAIYDWAVVLDHQCRRAQLVTHQRFSGTQTLLPGILARLQRASHSPADTFTVRQQATSNFTRDRYAAAFTQIQHYLHAGDCYQINLAQRYSAAATGNAIDAYLLLRSISPAPYSAFLNLPQAQILCASPERFLRVQGGNVETKPIKGTRPRSTDARKDKELIDELRNHPKDRAENLMIVDLLRNDLSKSCLPGSVQAPKLFEVESFANVHHLVSTVIGKLSPGCDAPHLLRDCFPGGSVTGAPKQRAMEIIEQLEPHRRGLYCGAIGYIGFDGDMDSNIVIRTLIYSAGQIHCWAGSGIVADSDMTAEYQETLDKAAAMLQLLQHYRKE
ncbi:MAG: aminodeoxychorismate synthase component I [Pseudomonadota bacterium]